MTKRDLSGFHRGKVINNIDTQLSGKVGVYVLDLMSAFSDEINESFDVNIPNQESNMIWITPTNAYNESSKDIKLYDNTSGSYNTPRIGEYVAVFFLNNDLNQGYYIPGISLPLLNQITNGFNLSTSNKEDFVNTERKPNIWLKEFWNRNIIGFNNNEDTQELFIKFDNGVELKFSSPNEQSNGDNHKSNLTKPSELIVSIKRLDSQYETILDLKADNKTASSNIGVSKNKDDDGVNGYELSYSTPITGEAKVYQYVDNDGSVSVFNTEYTKDFENYNTHSKTITATDTSLDSSEKISSMFLGTTSSELNDNKNASKSGIRIINKYQFSLIKDTYDKSLFNKKIELINKKGTIIKSMDIKSEKESSSLINKSEMVYNSIICNDVFSYINSDNAYSGSITLNKKINKSETSYDLIINKNYVSDENKRSVIESNYKVDNDSSSYRTSNYDDNFKSTISSTITRNKKSKVSISNSYNEPNPIDIIRTLDLPPMYSRGHIIEMEAEQSSSVIRLKSLKSGLVPVDPMMGSENYIEWKETGTESVITISMVGINKAAGIKLTLSTNGNGSTTLELPMGDINIKSVAGNITAATESGRVNVSGNMVNVKALTNAKIEAVSATIKADMVNVKSRIGNISGEIITIKGSNMINLRSNAMVNIKAPQIRLGNSPNSPMMDFNKFAIWAMSHVHPLGSSSTLKTITPIDPTMAKPNIMV